jgi:hypothetical protein
MIGRSTDQQEPQLEDRSLYVQLALALAVVVVAVAAEKLLVKQRSKPIEQRMVAPWRNYASTLLQPRRRGFGSHR